MEEKSKVMEKWQTVIPKRIREAANIGRGDSLTWKYKSGVILIQPPKKISKPSEALYGLIASTRDAVREVREVRRRRTEKIQR